MSIRVLLVDDEMEFVNYTAKRLAARGMQVHIAHSGDSALEFVAGHPVDVVVLDLLMPGMHGFEVSRKIKKACPAAQVIILSGHVDQASLKAGEALGVVDYIRKPCEFANLLEAINRAVSQSPT